MSAITNDSPTRRVKLYMLNDDRQWDDKGTGYISYTLLADNETTLIVKSETDGSHLLESKIENDTAYQKQQDTLIVWSESENVDLALSFQDKDGCDDIWQKICNIQGKDPLVEVTQDLIDDDDDEDVLDKTLILDSEELPACALEHLARIREMCTQVVNYPLQREKLAITMSQTKYIPQLVDLFRQVEAVGDETALGHLHDIAHALIMFNRRHIHEQVFSEEHTMDFIGMLEYSPGKARVHHRNFLLEKATYKDVLPIDASLKKAITQTYRLQYVQESCMPIPSFVDISVGATLGSLVNVKKNEIVAILHEDDHFLTRLLDDLLDTATTPARRLDLVLLLREFCTIAKFAEMPKRDAIFASLCRLGALKAIFAGMSDMSEAGKYASVDLVQIFVDNQLRAVREFMIGDERYMNSLIDLLVKNVAPDLGLGVIVLDVVKVLLDTITMAATFQCTLKQDLLNFVYTHAMPQLAHSLIDLNDKGQIQRDYFSTEVVLDLLAFCVEKHPTHMRHFVVVNDLLARMDTLLHSRHKSLVLAALRILRKFVSVGREPAPQKSPIQHDKLGRA